MYRMRATKLNRTNQLTFQSNQVLLGHHKRCTWWHLWVFNLQTHQFQHFEIGMVSISVSAKPLMLATSWAQSGKEIRLPACHRPKISWGPRKSTGMATAASPACSILTLFGYVKSWERVIDMGRWNMTWSMRVLGCDDEIVAKGEQDSLFLVRWHVELWASGLILTVLRTCLPPAHKCSTSVLKKCHCHKTKALRWLLQFFG